MQTVPIRRSDGLVVRPALAVDMDGLAAVCGANLGDLEGRNVRTVFRPSFQWMPLATVAVDGDRIVSTSLLLTCAIRVGASRFPASQIEWVATDPDYRNRGLVRDQVALLQRVANAQGSLLEFIDGIPHYYRRLGYEYALPHPATFRLPRGIPIPNGHELRPARWADIDSIVELHDRAAQAADVAACRREEHWRWILGDTLDDEHALVATCNGEVVAFARAVVEEGQTWVKEEVAGRDVAGAQAVLAGAVALGSAPTTGVIGRAHPVVGMVCDRFGHRSHEGLALYARLPDPLALLRALQPELSARLVSSPWRDQDGDLTISTYRTGYRLTYRHGEVTAIERVRALMYPVEQGGIGIPEDQLAGFLLGRRDPRLLADSVDDVLLGRNEELARTLLPPLRYDHLPLVV